MNWRKATANIVLFVTLVNISQPIMAGHFDDARAFGAAKKIHYYPMKILLSLEFKTQTEIIHR